MSPALDPIIHASARLQLMVFLSSVTRGTTVSFARLRDELQLTPGNLITHIRKLEEANYVASTKGGSGETSYWITDAGRAAFVTYRKELESLLNPS